MDNHTRSDAFVFFGATGDLAYKKIFPALQAMVKRGSLDMPVIGVGKASWNLDQLKARALESLEKHGGVDPEAFRQLSSLLRYVDGDYQDPATFEALGKELQSSRRPAHYLAIPPATITAVRLFPPTKLSDGSFHDPPNYLDRETVVCGYQDLADREDTRRQVKRMASKDLFGCLSLHVPFSNLQISEWRPKGTQSHVFSQFSAISIGRLLLGIYHT